jgi:hypothetical protein
VFLGEDKEIQGRTSRFSWLMATTLQDPPSKNLKGGAPLAFSLVVDVRQMLR